MGGTNSQSSPYYVKSSIDHPVFQTVDLLGEEGSENHYISKTFTVKSAEELEQL